MNRLRDIVEREGGMRAIRCSGAAWRCCRRRRRRAVLPETRARVWRAIRRATKPASRGLRILVLKFAVVGDRRPRGGDGGRRDRAPVDRAPASTRRPARCAAPRRRRDRDPGPRASPPAHVEAARVEAPVELPGEGPAETAGAEGPGPKRPRKPSPPAVEPRRRSRASGPRCSTRSSPCGASTIRSAPARCWRAICRRTRGARCARRPWSWPSKRRTRAAIGPPASSWRRPIRANFRPAVFSPFARSHTD